MQQIMRICVCGGRDYDDYIKVAAVLTNALVYWPNMIIINGAAKGADQLATQWALVNNVPVELFPADWKNFGSSAGPIRNKKMLGSKIDLLIAFPGGKGTDNMIKICQAANVKVYKAYSI